MLKRQSGGWWWEPPKGMPTHVYTVRIEDTCIVHRVGMQNPMFCTSSVFFGRANEKKAKIKTGLRIIYPCNALVERDSHFGDGVTFDSRACTYGAMVPDLATTPLVHHQLSLHLRTYP